MFVSWKGRSDAKLVQQVLAGHNETFGILVQRHLTSVHAMIRGHIDNPADTEDVAQESFITAYQKLDTLRSHQAFAPWLISIARNTALMWRRRQKHETLLDPDTLANLPAPAQPVEQQELQRLLHQGLRLLEEEPREILLLHYFGGKSLREIASLLNISREAAAKRLQRARATLTDNLLETMNKQPAAKNDIQRQSKKILAAVLAAPVAWQASAAQAAVAGTSALLLKCVAGIALTAVAGSSLWVAQQSLKSEETIVVSSPLQQVSTETIHESPTPPSKTEPPKTNPAPEFLISSTPPEGPGRIEGTLVDIQQNPSGPGTVFLERVTWKPTEHPPASTDRWSTTADDKGNFFFERLPYGDYALAALGNNRASAEDAFLRAARPTDKVELMMVPISPLTGKIEDNTGSPISNAVIYPVAHALYPTMEFPHIFGALARTLSNPDGTFQFPALPPGGIKFFVVVENRPPAFTEFLFTMGGKVKITLQPAGSVSGYVSNTATGAHLANVRLNVHAGDSVRLPGDSSEFTERIHRETQTDANGNFHIDSLAPGNYTLSINDAVMAPAGQDPEITLAPSESKTDIELPVIEGATIAGRILDASTKEGIAGIKIFGLYGFHSLDRTSITSASGNFLFTGLPKGHLRLNPDCAPANYLVEQWKNYELDVQPGQNIEYFEIILYKGLQAEGRVLDTEKRPAEGAEIFLIEPSNKRFSPKIITDREGKFRLPLLLTDENIKICAIKDDWRSKDFRGRLNDPALDLTLCLDTSAAAQIEGCVLDPSGKPFHGASVHLWDTPRPLTINCFTHTNKMGRFTLDHLPAGEFKVGVFPPLGGAACAEETITLADRQILNNLEFQCGEEGTLRISGKIVDPENHPVSQAQVTLSQLKRSITTGKDGQFLFDKLAPDEYTIEVFADSYPSLDERNIPAGTEDFVITLHHPVELAGMVIDATNNTPVENFDIEGIAYNHRIHTRQCRGTQGRFTLDDLFPGNMSLKIISPGYVTWESKDVEIIPGKTNELAFSLAPAGIVEGRVINEAGQPVQDVCIGPLEDSGSYPEEHALAKTGIDGMFTISSLEPEKVHRLSASHANYAPEPFEVSPTVGKNAPCTITLHNAGSIALHVFLDQAPASQYHASTSVYPASEQPRTYCDPNAQGLCTLKHLALGNHIIEISLKSERKQSFQTKKIPVIVVPGDSEPLQVHFSSGTASVEGLITENGQPVQEGRVSVHLENDSDDFHTSVEIEPGGRYQIDELPAGQCQWTASIHQTTCSLYKTTMITLAGNERVTGNHDFTGNAGIQGHVLGIKPLDYVSVSIYEGVIPPSQIDTNLVHLEVHSCAYASVESDGSFIIDHLLPGTYTLAVRAREQTYRRNTEERSAVSTVELTNDAVTPAEITLP